MKALSACKILVKALKKNKNDILYIQLGHIGKSHSKQINSMINNIDGNPSKICFCKIYIKAKITKNLSKKLISTMIEKLKRVYMDF